MLKKIVFMGTPTFSVPILKSLYQNGYSISAVYTQAPQKSNRGMKVTKSPVQLIAETLSLEIRTPRNFIKNEEEYEYLKKLSPDLVLVVAYGQIIPENFLKLAKKGFINIHASLLPNYRGAAPIQRSIMNLDNETGISIMKIEEKLDSGPICNHYKVKIDKKNNSEKLSEKLSMLASEKILENIDDIFQDKLEFVKQDESKATYAKKIEKSEGKINWNDTAQNILGKINGLYPNPGAWFIYKGERYKILKAEIGSSSLKIGEVINDHLEISCKNGTSIKILQIQRQGKNTQNINEFVLGSKIKKGSNLNNV